MFDRYDPKGNTLTPEREKAIIAVSAAASDLAAVLAQYLHEGRETSLAMTKLDECVMWATKSITR
jgi:hypothetical protein